MVKIKNTIAEILQRKTTVKRKSFLKPNKSYFYLKARQKRQQRKNIKDYFKQSCNDVHKYLGDRDVCIDTVGFKKKEPGWTPDAIKFSYSEKTGAEKEHEKKERAKKISFSRRVNYISDATYDRFKRSAERPDCPIDFPSARKTKKICDDALKEARFEKMQRNNYGYFVPADIKIRRVIEENWKNLAHRIKDKTIRLD